MKEPYEITEEDMAKSALHHFSEELETMALTAPKNRRQLQVALEGVSRWEKMFTDKATLLQEQLSHLDEKLMWEIRNEAERISDKIGNQSRWGLIIQLKALKDKGWYHSIWTGGNLPSGPEDYLDDAINYLTGNY